MPINPSWILSQYRRSPSGPVITCWSVAEADPAAFLKESVAFRRPFSSVVHASERNGTGTSTSWGRGVGRPGSIASARYRLPPIAVKANRTQTARGGAHVRLRDDCPSGACSGYVGGSGGRHRSRPTAGPTVPGVPGRHRHRLGRRPLDVRRVWYRPSDPVDGRGSHGPPDRGSH